MLRGRILPGSPLRLAFLHAGTSWHIWDTWDTWDTLHAGWHVQELDDGEGGDDGVDSERLERHVGHGQESVQQSPLSPQFAFQCHNLQQVVNT